MKIIGIGGTDGSGKDTIAEMLVESRGWLFVSVTDLLREEAKKRGISYDRSHLREISAEWRRQFGHGVLIDRAVEAYRKASGVHPGLVIASLRHPGEADEVHKLGGKVVWVDADPHVRYERITKRQRGKEDMVTFEEFLAEEKAQSSHGHDEATVNMGAVKEKADIVIENNGSDIEAFMEEADKALTELM